jgi:hypothetical protein
MVGVDLRTNNKKTHVQKRLDYLLKSCQLIILNIQQKDSVGGGVWAYDHLMSLMMNKTLICTNILFHILQEAVEELKGSI